MKTKKRIIREKSESESSCLDPSETLLSNTNIYVGVVMRASRTGCAREMKVRLNKMNRKWLFIFLRTMAQR